MTLRVRILPAAERDLENQSDYIGEHEGEEQALALYESAQQTFALAARHPHVGRITRFRHPMLRGVRVLRMSTFRNHLVFYRVADREIQIVRVLHGARDLDNLFDD